MYYRLGLYKIDRLCSNETANLLKVPPHPLSSGLTLTCLEHIDPIGHPTGPTDL